MEYQLQGIDDFVCYQRGTPNPSGKLKPYPREITVITPVSVQIYCVYNRSIMIRRINFATHCRLPGTACVNGDGELPTRSTPPVTSDTDVWTSMI